MIARSLRMNDTSKSSPIRLVSYLTDTQGHGQRVADVRVTNCDSDEASWAAMEMTVTQRMNTRAQGDKTYHLMVSFQAHERPNAETIRAIEEDMCERLGFDGHQRVSVLHDDTDNLHLHICINKIHPERLTIHTPYYDHKTLATSSIRLEKHFNLAEDNHIPRTEAAETAAKAMEHAGDMESLIGWMQRNCLDGLKKAESWADAHAVLREHGLTVRERGNGLVFVNGEIGVKASSVDRTLSKKRLEERFGPFEAVQDRGRPAESSKKYEKKPMQHKEFDSSELWRRYQGWREEQDQVRKHALVAARQQRDEALNEARQFADTRTLVIRHMVKGAVMKRILHAMNRAQLRQKRERILSEYKKKLAQHKAQPNWRNWLQDEALKGNVNALAALRARDSQQRTVHKSGTQERAVKVTSKGTFIFSDGSRDTGLRQQPETWRIPPQTLRKESEHRKSRGR